MILQPGARQPATRHVGRLAFVDAVRACAAFLVLAQHSLESSRILNLDANGFTAGTIDLGQAGIMAFFIISGFAIPISMEKTNSIRAFFISRVFRIYPLYMLALLFSLIFLVDLSKDTISKIVISHIFFFQEYVLDRQNTVPGSWTLGIEVLWYLTYVGIFVGRFHRNTFVLVCIVCLSSFTLILVSALIQKSLPFGRLGLFLGFFAGLVSYEAYMKRLPRAQLFFLLAFLYTVSMFGAFIRFEMLKEISRGIDFSFRSIWTSWTLGYCVFFSAYFFSEYFQSNNLINNAFSYLGKVSYSTYLIHSFMIALALVLGISSFALLAFVVVTSIALSHFTFKYVEMPAIAAGRALIGRLANPAVPLKQES